MRRFHALGWLPGHSCMSCHGRSSYPAQPLSPSGASRASYTHANFANLPPGAEQLPQGAGVYLGYSLQLASGAVAELPRSERSADRGAGAAGGFAVLAALILLAGYPLRRGAPRKRG